MTLLQLGRAVLIVALSMVCDLNAIGANAAVDISDAPKPAFWARRVVGYLTTADGTKLRYSALLPGKKGHFPVALIYSGYDTGSIGGAAYLQNDVTFSVDLEKTLLESGYAVVGVNARATGCSEGDHFSFLGAKYGQDGRDAVEFIASQPWSNGNVGMFGWSWGGMSQLATASNRPPHLKAIAPGMVLGDQRLDNSAPGGVTAYAMAGHWRGYLHARWEAVRQSAQAEGDTQCLNQLLKNQKLEEESSWVRELLRHPLRDDWTEEQRLSARTHMISVPVLSVESFQDEATTSREGYYHDTLDPKRTWLLQTNGGHDLYESHEFRKMLVAFLDRFVKGKNNRFDDHPHLTVWMETHSSGTGINGYMEQAKPEWQYTSAELSPAVTPLRFAISGQGKLLSEHVGNGLPDSYTYPVPGPAINADFGRDAWGELPGNWRKGSLAYTSSPLEHDTVIYGSGSADLWIDSDALDADVQVTVTAVMPNNQEMFLQRGWLRLSNRALDLSRSTALRPVLLDRPESLRPLNPKEPVLVRVEINKFAAAMRRGSRVRIWIDAPSPTGEYQFDHVAWPAENRIWHDSDHRSELVLGELRDVSVPKEISRCGSALKQPCRADPLAKSVEN